MTQPQNAVSLRELAFVRDVLMPRAWVRGAEVDELVHLRFTIEQIFRRLSEAPASAPASPTSPATAADPPGEEK